ncbi:hypothetical protein QBC45DRAFT_237858 [Copromyces sp. CBS 386.78]|nr:hypothetical protein QBC45DRAFT_237858 [Copromyces sp. CBS 386.78]
MMAPHAWAAGPRKRSREDDYADASMGGVSGFSEHRNKRQQILPVRTSPTAKRWMSTPSFAPENPQPVVTGYEYYGVPEVKEQHVWAAEPELPSNYSPESMDMEMMDCEPEPRHQEQQHHHQQYLQPGNFQPDHLAPEPTISGRIPTPIHCSFAEQVRGKHWGGAAGNISMDHRGSYGVPPPTQQHHEPSVSLIGHESVPRSLDGAAATAQVMEDWSMVQNRRLPSPISEVGGDMEDNGMGESPRMILESYHPGHQHHHDHEHHGHHLQQHEHPLPRQRLSSLDQLTHSHPLLSAMPLRNSSLNSQMGPREPTPIPQGEHECQNHHSHGSMDGMDMGSPQTSPKTLSPPNKRGHQRSKHTVSSWTMGANQAGMKRSFSIGYRDDCEKCRMKVPGHFNHIIVS